MPVLLEGSCHCRAVKYTVESNTPVPFCLCQCSICRKVGGYMGSVNIMGNYNTFKILRGEDKIKVYQGALEFDANDKPTKPGNSKRSFCSNCSSMLWNYHDEWPEWIYPFASTIDKPNPLPPIPEGYKLIAIKRDSCPDHVPLPEGVKGEKGYGSMESIEAWHKKTGAWVD
ncbi:Mss4-like protein [Papiliotrema laurentii]|uniref:Mss4-like protein n=1 Tax=Papiliotrema laurentii TaxID=5418 RepID=A0AAD9FMI5_PAPLA|nr:Mss4-like protein [Papiliotrema laurentii]